MSRSPIGQPLADDYTVAYRQPEVTSPRGLDGPGLVKLPERGLVGVVPAEMNDDTWACQVVRSDDGGRSWERVTQLPYYSGVPWTYDGTLYLFGFTEGSEYRNDDVHLLSSEDGGATWSAPVTVAEGHFWNCQTGMVIRDDHLYWAVDDLEPGGNYRGHRVIAGDLSDDPMSSAAWRLSNLVQFPGLPPSLTNIENKFFSNRMLEPGVIEAAGRLRVLSTVKPPGQATTNLGAVFDIQDDGGSIELSFTQYHPIPGGQVKFCVVKDDETETFWAGVNLPVDGQNQLGLSDPEEHRQGDLYDRGHGGNDRRFLMLMYGLDGLNWFPAGCVARAGRLSRSFMYPALCIDGEDMLLLARSSLDAPNRHDADAATFHRITDFRGLAMDLRQDID